MGVKGACIFRSLTVLIMQVLCSSSEGAKNVWEQGDGGRGGGGGRRRQDGNYLTTNIVQG